MSKDERMDRAERIRKLREGNRTTDHAEETADADEPRPDDEPADAAVAATKTDEADDAAEADDQAEGATLDDAVVEAVERVSGAEASVPSPEEMAADASTAEETGEDRPSQSAESEAGSAATTSPDEAGEVDEAVAEEPDATGDSDADDQEGVPGAGDGVGHRAAADTRVLEFSLGDEYYGIDIEYVEEIVKDETVTRVPNTPEFVEGVVDLRGQITTILNPKLLIDADDTEPGELLVVFDGDAFDEQGHLGWIVDDVRQVAPVAESAVNEPPVAEDYINGVIDRGDDDPYVVWTSPERAIDAAT